MEMKRSKYHFKFEDLLIYQKAMVFGEDVNELTQTFPSAERFNLISQYNRAADSIALNIAEGASGTDKQFLHYLSNAYRSLHECVACNAKALRREYITFQQSEKYRKQMVELAKMISSLRRTIAKRIST